ncbi:Hypothetical protein AA314_01697 [Archangium gephyra]|uniref:Uncharacterized protein n=1 Tax=Archangium gephyra TaxID=48 RepID=A0AAC8Q344_9BACT|nr:Hypothetical protein AA314_01697 [Archangium gephyra]
MKAPATHHLTCEPAVPSRLMLASPLVGVDGRLARFSGPGTVPGHVS